MKILYISTINLSLTKGETTHFTELGHNLEKMGNELLIICRGEKNQKYGFNNIRLIPQINASYLSIFFLDAILGLYLFFYILKFKPDAVYYRGITWGGIISRLLGIPSIAEANGIYHEEISLKLTGIKKKIIPAFHEVRERVNYSAVTKIICVTEGIKSELGVHFGINPLKCKVLSNGANDTTFHPLETKTCRKEIGLDPDGFYLGFIGTFKHWHGLDILISAMDLVIKKGFNNIKCVLVGDGPLFQNMKEAVEYYNLMDNVFFLGSVAHNNIVKYINSFDICVNPSRSGMASKIGLSSLKIYEYLACTRPVIASRIKGITELVKEGNCGYLFEPDNFDELASRIIEAYENRQNLASMGLCGRKLIEEKYSWKKVAQRTQKILEETLKK